MKTALITGASTGIGYELAWLFAKDYDRLILVARDMEKLNRLSEEIQSHFDVEIRSIRLDLSVPSSCEELFRELQNQRITIDALVNNAGFGLLGSYLETDAEAELQMIQVNITALTHLTKLLVPGMVERGRGRILNVASTAAFQAGPYMAVYYATKAYVLSYSQAIALELRGTGVSVTTLCPGPTKTDFQTRANMEESKVFKNRWMKVMDAKKVAEIGYRGLMKGSTIVIPGKMNRILVFVNRLLPRALISKAIQKIQAGRK